MHLFKYIIVCIKGVTTAVGPVVTTSAGPVVTATAGPGVTSTTGQGLTTTLFGRFDII